MLPEDFFDRGEVFSFGKDIYFAQSPNQFPIVVKNDPRIRRDYEQELGQLKEGVVYQIESGKLNHEIQLTRQTPQNMVYSLEQAANNGILLTFDPGMTRREVRGLETGLLDLFRIGPSDEFIGASSRKIAILSEIGKEITGSNDVQVKIGEDLQLVLLSAGEIIGGLAPDYIADYPYNGVRTILGVESGQVTKLNYRGFEMLKKLI